MVDFLKEIVEMLQEQKKTLEAVSSQQLGIFCQKHLQDFFGQKLNSGQGDFFLKYEPGQEDADPQQEHTNDEVNGIIMKIELKKF